MSVSATPLQPEVLSATISSAAARCGWSLSAGRADELAHSAMPTLAVFARVRDTIDFDSDPLAFLAVRDSVKHNETDSDCVQDHGRR